MAMAEAQLIHLGAVSLSHNHVPYAIRGRLVYDFRDAGGGLMSFRLEPLTLSPSPAAAPAAIDVALYGRWRRAAAGLRKQDVVQVECAVVARSEDRQVNSVRLQLHDPMPSFPHARRGAICVLDAGLRRAKSLTYGSLDAGSSAWASASPQRQRPARVSVGESVRDYVYTSIADIWQRTEGGGAPRREEKVNIYGVVVDCRAPCVTRGPDLRCEVVVADESSLREGELKTLAIYCFEKNPSDCIPFRGVGDVIRAHRINVGRYHDYATGVSTVQGVGRFYSTFLLWSHEGTDYLPIASRDPVRVSRANQDDHRNITHIVTSQDRERITTLRNWARVQFFPLHKVRRPYLRTVLEVKAADESAEFLTKNFDLICRMESENDDVSSEGKLRFVVTDGLLEGNANSQKLLVESEISDDHALRVSQYPFLEFCPSWENRPESLPSWLLIRDVRASMNGHEGSIRLAIGKKTSTLVWHPDNSPEVRHVREMFREAGAAASLRPGGSTVPPASMAPSRNGTTSPPIYNGTATAYGAGYGATHAARQSPSIPQPQLQQGAMLQTPAQPTHNLARKRSAPSPVDVAAAAASSHALRKAARIDTAAISSSQQQGPEKRHAPVNIDEAKLPTLHPIQAKTVVTTHPNKQFPVSSIAELRKAVSDGTLKPHRLRASARSCVAPRDVRFACRPWCERCKKFFKIDRNHGELQCSSCPATFSGTGDPNTKWAYLVRLNLEDGSGCRIECWILGEEATRFFTRLPPTNLLSNTAARQKVSKCLQMLLNPKHVLDCCVMPYQYEDKYDTYKTACQIFGTTILPEFLPKE